MDKGRSSICDDLIWLILGRKRNKKMHLLDKIPYSLLIILSLTLGLAPFTPAPHLIEKIDMLVTSNLSKPLDIFDLIMHSSPIVLLVMKMGRNSVR